MERRRDGAIAAEIVRTACSRRTVARVPVLVARTVEYSEAVDRDANAFE